MNTEQLIEKAEAVLTLTDEQNQDVMKLAAVGMCPRDIAAALELEPSRAAVFVALAAVPGSPVARAIAAGNASGMSIPQIKLQEAAAAGNIEAIRELTKAQARNRFNELLNNMDDDELAF